MPHLARKCKEKGGAGGKEEHSGARGVDGQGVAAGPEG